MKLIKFLDSFEYRNKAKVSVMSYSSRLHGLYSPWNSPGQNTGVGSLSLLQGIFPTQRSNPGLLHCRQILLPADPQGKPKNTGVGGLFFSNRSFQFKNRTGVSCIAGRFFTNWTIREAMLNMMAAKKEGIGPELDTPSETSLVGKLYPPSSSSFVMASFMCYFGWWVPNLNIISGCVYKCF